MQAQLCNPAAVFVSNGEVFIADMNNHRVRKVLRNGQIVTIAGTGLSGYNGDGQPATSAQLSGPVCVVVSSSNQVYISESSHRIRKIDQNGIISTIAGTGEAGYNGNGYRQLAVNAKLNFPRGLFVTEDEEVFIADMSNHRIRKIDRNGIITTIAGTSARSKKKKLSQAGKYQLATSTPILNPTSVFQYKNEIYLTDMGNNVIRKISQDGKITTINTKEGNNALDNMDMSPYFIVVFNDELFVSYHGKHMVRKIHLSNGTVETLIGNGNAGSSGDGSLAIHALLHHPATIFVDDSQVYIAEYSNNRIRRIDRNGIVDTIVGTGERGYSGDVPFDFSKYPHIGPKTKQLIKPFPKALFDITIRTDSDSEY